VTCILEAFDNFEEIVSAAHKVIKEFDSSTEHTMELKARFEDEKRVRTLAKRSGFDGRNSTSYESGSGKRFLPEVRPEEANGIAGTASPFKAS